MKDSKHNFHSAANDWGFTTFVGLDELHNPARHLKSADDTVIIKVEATVQAPIVEKPYDSKAETGFVGLKNQGATCYMNSLLQTLFNVNQFRRAVYHMPTDEDADPSASMPLALQSVFYKLQFGQTAVSTQDLTRSFGWDSADAFQQHDVQELNRILCDRLEEKMKGTRVEGMVNKLFEGQTLNYIDCINIDYKSSRREAFQDLQLDVKGCRDIYDSFDKYCEVETLEGDNKYEAEGHGKQDAKKGVLFDSLPPVLNLHLKRFEYDYTKDMMVKINDRHEFYEELDLDNGKEGAGAKYLSEDADRGVRNKYRLLAVLVHSGGVHGGHYYAYIRPDGKQWLKFDDEHVNKSDASEAIDNNWGSGGDDKASVTYGVAPVRIAPRFSNAYMLVYVRESEWDSVMCKVTEEDISEHVRARLKAEKEEKERLKREKAEAHLYTMVRIATDEDIKAQIGHTKSFDLVDMDAVGLTLKMKKSATFAEVQAEVTKRLNLPPEQQRYWQWAFRRNETFRPAKVLVVDSPDQTLQSLDERRQSQVYGRTPEMTKLDLFLETPTASSGAFIPLTNSSILLFFKRFIPDSSEQPACLEYAGRAILTKTNKVKDLPALCRKLAGLHPDTELSLAEEIKFEPDSFIEDMINPEVSLDKGEIEHGDIIVFQETAMEDGEFPKAADYFKFVRNRLSVTFKPLDGEEEGSPEFHLELLRNTTYEDVSAAVAQRLGLDDPLKVQFTQVNAFSHQPKPHPLRYVEASKMELFSMLPQKHNKVRHSH